MTESERDFGDTRPRLTNSDLILYRLDELRKGQEGMNSRLDRFPELYVTREEWRTRNAVVDEKFDYKGAEIVAVNKRIDSVSTSARANISLIVAVVAAASALASLVMK